MAVDETHEVEYLLTVNCEPTYTELRKVEMSLMRILSYIKRFCGDENVDKAVSKIQSLIMFIRSAQIAIRALRAAEMSDPILMVYAATVTVGAIISGVSAVQELGS